MPDSALLTIDVQEDFARLIPGTRECASAMRNADLCRRESIRGGSSLVAPGSDGAELLADLKPDRLARLDADLLMKGGFQELGKNEWAMYKPRWDAFHGTPLEAHLRGLGVATVSVVGCNFPNCPRATIYGAGMRDFRVAVFPEAISGIYDRGLEELANIGVEAMRCDDV